MTQTTVDIELLRVQADEAMQFAQDEQIKATQRTKYAIALSVSLAGLIVLAGLKFL